MANRTEKCAAVCLVTSIIGGPVENSSLFEGSDLFLAGKSLRNVKEWQNGWQVGCFCLVKFKYLPSLTKRGRYNSLGKHLNSRFSFFFFLLHFRRGKGRRKAENRKEEHCQLRASLLGTEVGRCFDPLKGTLFWVLSSWVLASK